MSYLEETLEQHFDSDGIGRLRMSFLLDLTGFFLTDKTVGQVLNAMGITYEELSGVFKAVGEIIKRKDREKTEKVIQALYEILTFKICAPKIDEVYFDNRLFELKQVIEKHGFWAHDGVFIPSRKALKQAETSKENDYNYWAINIPYLSGSVGDIGYMVVATILAIKPRVIADDYIINVKAFFDAMDELKHDRSGAHAINAATFLGLKYFYREDVYLHTVKAEERGRPAIPGESLYMPPELFPVFEKHIDEEDFSSPPVLKAYEDSFKAQLDAIIAEKGEK
jgi:hypothetical protein